jgi:hypothetical protein
MIAGALTDAGREIFTPRGGNSEPNRPNRRQRRLARTAPLGASSSSLRFASAQPPRQNPANSRLFRGRHAQSPPNLRIPGLHGGGCSPERTSLWCQFPDQQGKYREIFWNRTFQASLAA